jgi:hypothetical protein
LEKYQWGERKKGPRRGLENSLRDPVGFYEEERRLNERRMYRSGNTGW